MVSVGDERMRSVQACNSLIGGVAARGRIRRTFSGSGVMQAKSRLVPRAPDAVILRVPKPRSEMKFAFWLAGAPAGPAPTYNSGKAHAASHRAKDQRMFPQDEMSAAEDGDGVGRIRLPANGGTVAAEELRVRLVLAADVDGRIEVDASEVESVGQAVLQLLVAARAEAEANGQSYLILNPSAAFTDRVTGCRLAAAVGLSTQGSDLL